MYVYIHFIQVCLAINNIIYLLNKKNFLIQFFLTFLVDPQR